MGFFLALLTVAAVISALLAPLPSVLRATLKELSWVQFLRRFAVSFFGILLPAAFFFLSALLVPDAKDHCHNGWIDCFYEGKLALTPLVLWASTALYAIEIWQVQNRRRAWIIYGILLGSISSAVCLVFGLVTSLDAAVLLVVPLYTAIWYVWRAIQLMGNAEAPTLFAVLGGSLPFWAASAFWSYTKYISLPQHSQDCFVVTAASRGHREFVGPFLNVTHRGRPRIANQQLATLWAFEALWRRQAPRSHRAFRRVYDFVGPIIARRISSPWVADIFYLALKPAEFFAGILMAVCALRKIKTEPRCLGSSILNARQS